MRNLAKVVHARVLAGPNHWTLEQMDGHTGYWNTSILMNRWMDKQVTGILVF